MITPVTAQKPVSDFNPRFFYRRLRKLKNDATGFARLLSAAKFSKAGLKSAYASEAAFRQEVWLALVLIPLGIWLGDNALEKALLVASILFLMIVELLNTAIEAVVDRIGDEYHPLSGKAKDVCSAAVLLAIFMVLIVWAGVLLN